MPLATMERSKGIRYEKSFFFLSIITICLVSGCAHAQQPSPNNKSGSANEQKPPTHEKKVLVAYFSRSGNTREIANQIHGIVGGDIFEIQTAKPYPDDYDAVVKQATEEGDPGYQPPFEKPAKVFGIKSNLIYQREL